MCTGRAPLCLSGTVPNIRHRATTACRINLFHAQHISRAYPHTKRKIVLAQRAEALNDLAIDLDSHKPLPIIVEATRRASFTQETAFQRRCGIGCETKETAPQRSDERPLEYDCAGHCDDEQCNPAQQRARNYTGETETHQQAEQYPGRCKRQQRGFQPARVMRRRTPSGVCASRVRASRVTRMTRSVCMRQMRVPAGIMSTRTIVRPGMRKAGRSHGNETGTAKHERECVGIHMVLLQYTRRAWRTMADHGRHHFVGALPPTIDAMRASSAPVVEHTIGAVPNAIGVAVAWISVATSVPFSAVGLRRETTLMLTE